MPTANPWLHPQSGFYYFRKKVPVALRAVVGREIEKFSLGTKDPVAARRLFDIHEVEARKRWKKLEIASRRRKETWALSPDTAPRLRELSVREATQIGRQFYDAKKADYEVDLFEPWHENGCRIVLSEYVEDRHGADSDLQADFDDMYGDLVDAYLAMHEIVLTGPARQLLDRSVAAALLQALNEIFDRMRGDFSDEKKVSRFPDGNFNDRPSESIPLSIIGSFEEYARLKELSPSTVKRWGAVMGNLVHHVGHDDARRLDHRTLAAWRNHLLKARHAITVRDVYVAALRTTLEWLVQEQELSINVAAKVKVPVPKKDELRSKSLNDSEVARILAASLLPHDNLGPVHADARRWVPWICAYTGARVNEITQMRRQDVRRVDGIWSFRITPEAGTVKNRKARVIPVHPHLVEQGLLDFVSREGPDEMFYNARARKDGEDPIPTYKKTGERLAEWVRDDLGITDKGIGPNHGWRHRFKTVGRRSYMNPLVLDAIQGHSSGTESAKYGEFPLDVMLTELNRMPWYVVEGVSPTKGDRAADLRDMRFSTRACDRQMPKS